MHEGRHTRRPQQIFLALLCAVLIFKGRNLVSASATRALKAFPVSRVAVNSESAILLSLGQNGLSTAGNLTYSETNSGGFQLVSSSDVVPVITTISNGTWVQSVALFNSDCITVRVNATEPVHVLVITAAGFISLASAITRGDSINQYVQAPAVPDGGVYYNKTSVSFTVAVPLEGAYVLGVLNPSTILDIGCNYTIAASSQDAAECRAVRATPQTVASPIQAAGTFSYLNPGRVASYMSFTGAACMAYGLSFRQGPDNSGRVDLDTNVLSTKVPVPPIGLESYIGVLNKANLTAWGQAQFVNLHSYVTGSLCIVTHNLPGPCITYVDGLDPNEDYAVWLVQRDLPSNPTVDMWTWSFATGRSTGSCANIWPTTNTPIPTLSAPPPPALAPAASVSASSSSSSRAGPIAGGVAGGVVAILAIGAISIFVCKRRKRMLHGTYAPGSTSQKGLDSGDFLVTGHTAFNDPKLALPLPLPSKSFGSSESETSKGDIMSSGYASGAITNADFSDVESRFGMLGEHHLPAPCQLPSEQGILSVADAGESDLPARAAAGESMLHPAGSTELEDTWIIQPQDLACRVVDGKPVLLGSGGFGNVYLGLLNGVREVAVKIVKSHNQQQQARFIREIRTLKACLDPNIVQFLGASIRGHQILMVMQYMRGGNLYDRLARDNASALRWYNSGRQVALDIVKGLVFLHKKKIAHLDLKSPNILLTEQGEAKISDVGLGKIIAGSSITATQQGSFLWASPEQLLCQATTTASDMFSMGTVLWEICTGDQPIGRLLRPVAAPQEAPQPVIDVINRCLAKDPHDRPTAVELHDILLNAPLSL